MLINISKKKLKNIIIYINLYFINNNLFQSFISNDLSLANFMFIILNINKLLL